MADIAASDVTYTVQPVNGGSYIRPAGRRVTRATLVFGNNTLTYPTGGIPLTAGKLGFPGALEELNIVDQGTNAKGFKFEFNSSTGKLRVMVEDTVATNTPLKEHTNATFVPNPATLIVEAVGY